MRPCCSSTINTWNVVFFFGIKALGSNHLRSALPEAYYEVIFLGFNKDNNRGLQIVLVWR